MQDKTERSAIADHSDPQHDEQFAIAAASSLQDVRPLVLKHGDGFGVFDGRGDVRPAPGGAQGVYYQDTRHLSGFALTIDGARPAAAQLDPAGRQCDADLRPHQSGLLRQAEGKLELPHDLIHLRRSRFLMEIGLLRTDQRPQLRRSAPPPRDRGGIRGGFRRPVRGSRLSPQAPRGDLHEPRDRRRLRRPELHRPRQAIARRPRCVSIRRRRRLNGRRALYAVDLEAREVALDLHRGRLSAGHAGGQARQGLFRRVAGRPARTARFVLAGRRDRDLQRDLQRGGAPQRRRSLHADHPVAGGALPLRRNPLVQHGVRARRDHHRAGNALARSFGRARRAAAPRGDPGDDRRRRGGRRARQDPA